MIGHPTLQQSLLLWEENGLSGERPIARAGRVAFKLSLGTRWRATPSEIHGWLCTAQGRIALALLKWWFMKPSVVYRSVHYGMWMVCRCFVNVRYVFVNGLLMLGKDSRCVRYWARIVCAGSRIVHSNLKKASTSNHWTLHIERPTRIWTSAWWRVTADGTWVNYSIGLKFRRYFSFSRFPWNI